MGKRIDELWELAVGLGFSEEELEELKEILSDSKETQEDCEVE